MEFWYIWWGVRKMIVWRFKLDFKGKSPFNCRWICSCFRSVLHLLRCDSKTDFPAVSQHQLTCDIHQLHLSNSTCLTLKLPLQSHQTCRPCVSSDSADLFISDHNTYPDVDDQYATDSNVDLDCLSTLLCWKYIRQAPRSYLHLSNTRGQRRSRRQREVEFLVLYCRRSCMAYLT